MNVTKDNYETILKETDLNKLYKSRREKVYDYMQKNNIAAAVFEDWEDGRDSNVRYLSSHPTDAILILLSNRTSVLIPWDINLAEERAKIEKIVPYTDYKRDSILAIKETLKDFSSTDGTKLLCLSPATTFLQYKKILSALPGWKLLCSDENTVHQFVKDLRAVKDEYEIACTMKACDITSNMTDIIVPQVINGQIKTEMDLALFIERELRLKGCERTSFDTLAAGPKRSYAIHAFPGYTAGTWGEEGLSILDYGVCYEGYASDCTITIAKGHLPLETEELLSLVQKAADECIKLYKPNSPILSAVKKADDIFREAGRAMPHGLGHGTGLDIHEEPFISKKAKEGDKFKAGNIITLEPGLYDQKLGGCRLENDVLITESGNQVLTNSKIFRI